MLCIQDNLFNVKASLQGIQLDINEYIKTSLNKLTDAYTVLETELREKINEYCYTIECLSNQIKQKDVEIAMRISQDEYNSRIALLGQLSAQSHHELSVQIIKANGMYQQLQSDYDALSKVQRDHLCPVCLEIPMKCVFTCGHVTCETCLPLLSSCPICRNPNIREVIRLHF